jgi:hypothetical protein
MKWTLKNNIKYMMIMVFGLDIRVMVMVFNATFNNISVISWRSVLLVEETGVPGENHQPVASH